MPGKKKQFIDKKNAVTFHLVHRSQKDPLQADDAASKHVLLPREKRKEEEREFGVFFEDDYDYLQHLRDVDEINQVEAVEHVPSKRGEDNTSKEVKTKLNLPSSVFGSEVETEVGLLNKAAPLRGPQLDWDPDIVAALDDDFDFDDEENILDDDFISKANPSGSQVIREEDEDEWEDVDDEEDGVNAADHKVKLHKTATGDDEKDYASDEAEDSFSDQGSYGDNAFSDEETKSRFTNYSITSSVIRRNEGLTMLDNRFEKVFEEYDDLEIGALDHEDIDGTQQPDSDLLNNAMEEFEQQQNLPKLKDCIRKGNVEDIHDDDSADSNDDEDIVKLKLDQQRPKWDCESILSTHSTLYNHPQTIELQPKKDAPIKLTKRLNIPVDVIPTRGLTRRQMEENEREDDPADKATTYRPRGESTEERKERKQAIKAERKERRIERKINKTAFKEEHKKQTKEMINLKHNLQGITLS